MTAAALLLAAAIVSTPLFGLWYEFRVRRVKAEKERAQDVVWKSFSETTSW